MEGVAAVVAELIVVGLDLVFVVVDVLHAPAADIAEVAALMAAGIVVVVGVARVGVDIVVVGIAEVVAVVVVVVVVATDHRAAAAGSGWDNTADYS